MTKTSALITESVEWRALDAHHSKVEGVHLRELFAQDPGRGQAMTVEAADLYLDYSKNLVIPETLELLLALAERAELRQRAGEMFNGQRINVTEDRPVLHVALRAPEGTSIFVDGVNVVQRSTPCSARCERSPTGCAPASGLASPVAASPTWSTSGSGDRISVRRWRTRRSRITATAR
jgi:hypothetical protein